MLMYHKVSHKKTVMNFQEVHKMNELESVYVDDFEKIRQIIEQARHEAVF